MIPVFASFASSSGGETGEISTQLDEREEKSSAAVEKALSEVDVDRLYADAKSTVTVR